MKPWGVLIIGLVLGLAAGLLYTWVIAPPEYYNTYPPLLAATYRNEWIQMSVLAYGAEGNWSRTQLRLQGLAETEIRPIAAAALEQAVAAGRPLATLQRLAELAAFYGIDTPAVAIYTGANNAAPTPASVATTPAAPPTAAPTATPPPPTNTPIPIPTLTTTTEIAAALNAFRIVSQTLTCTDQPKVALSLALSHTITVRRRTEVEWLPVPGREVWLLWEDGADRAVTGFNAEMGLGYADFSVAPGRTYKLYIDVPRGAPVSTIQVEPCTGDEGEGWISRALVLLAREE
jgi:hypothetical protein